MDSNFKIFRIFLEILKQRVRGLCGDTRPLNCARLLSNICKHLSKATSLNSQCFFFCRDHIFPCLLLIDLTDGLRLLMSFSYDVSHYNEMWRNLKSSSSLK